ncbi:PAC2 family protein [Candidatus Woesearchaeota archaeon]|nr:PAC2 family protein [Candidatus Woesearchaeota archaeon]
MSTWRIDHTGRKPKLHDPVLIEGLPGIGNVGKVAVDFIIDEVKAVKCLEITSSVFPNAVFVTEENVVELPKVELYYKKRGGKERDLLLMAGDVQPIDEDCSYAFSEKILELAAAWGAREILTLGGIGLSQIPKHPKVYCTGNSPALIKEYTALHAKNQLYGVVGPIIGVSGLLLGLAERKKIKAAALLAETFGHPMYLGVKGAKEILKILNKSLHLKIHTNKLEGEIKEIESQMLRRSEDLKMISGKGAKALKGKGDVNYIG